jgi:hypothetical protein
MFVGNLESIEFGQHGRPIAGEIERRMRKAHETTDQ